MAYLLVALQSPPDITRLFLPPALVKKMASIAAILEFCEQNLDSASHKDYCPNGLQVAGKPEVLRVVSGVSACLRLIEVAIEKKADLLLVHHGYFWRGENPCLLGAKRERIRLLLEHGINLVAYHLPLDTHPNLGNNAQLARLLDFKVTGKLQPQKNGLGLVGEITEACSPKQLAAHIEYGLGQKPLLIEGGGTIKTLAWCSGAAQDFIDLAIERGVDAYLSGEISERTTHSARENGLNYFCIGHHASERGGVQALGTVIAERFDIEHEFVDVPNPV